MLRILQNLFPKKKESTDSLVEFDEPESSNVNFLTDPIKINTLLNNLEEDSPLCTISMDGTSEEFSTSILDVQIKKNHLIIDELFPNHGNELLIKNNKVKLSTLYNGIRLAFEIKDIHPGSSRNIAYYKVSIPSRIYYPQRRITPRIQINTLNIPFSGSSNRTNFSVSGIIFDLSRSGLGIYISNNRARIQRSDLIQNCQLQIDGSIVTFDLTVRFIKKTNTSSNTLLMGGYFENLSSKDKNKLEHFVASIERQEIRNQKDK